MDCREIIIKIITNQRKFNYDSLINIEDYVDCWDKTYITPLEFYCKKGNENKVLKILNQPKILIEEFSEYHPFLDCCFNLLIKASEVMIEKNYIPQNANTLINVLVIVYIQKWKK
jgi:hypothetical protein